MNSLSSNVSSESINIISIYYVYPDKYYYLCLTIIWEVEDDPLHMLLSLICHLTANPPLH